ncbi:RNA-binding (RRM/RBD/RNP motifs) family protein [Striga hermonthica]|uniref:RNA-binding (RRM/RBD/RNP motifs) family protein n=1 Tax=Striga hermonthica TaxID=68872 RepID=A0A9N7RNR5_STRHE|nr:RNA-binding (RRM/RBD/RNP motifs) family protein [Striga hermonthica]
MASLGNFPAQAHSSTLLPKPTAPYFPFPTKPHFSFPTRLNLEAARGRIQTGLHCKAMRAIGSKGGSSFVETDGPDEFEDDFDDGFLDLDDDGGGGGIEEDGDEDEAFMPMMNAKKWIEKRPRGFGEGKVYDTSIEDKLMEEIEQSRKAQLANVNKLKNSAAKSNPSSKKEINKEVKGATHIEDGTFRVRLLNLPKKKNIHKDLRLAFEGARGIVNIDPVVSGNEKTRDPVCKGLAFVVFKHQDEAQRFVQNFSGKSITFGKVQKQIRCELVNPKKSNPALEQLPHDGDFTLGRAIFSSDVKDVDVESDVSPLYSWEESAPIEVNDDDDEEEQEEINGTLTTSDSDLADELELKEGFAVNSSTSSSGRKSANKKKTSKRRKNNVSKLNIPGSANRLKIREKEMLTGVLSKYGAAVKEQSSQ